MANKCYLINYTIYCGEYQFSGQTTLTTDKVEDAIHDYFMHFYDDVCKKDCIKGKSYLYLMGEVGVRDIYYKNLTKAQTQVLHDLNIA